MSTLILLLAANTAFNGFPRVLVEGSSIPGDPVYNHETTPPSAWLALILVFMIGCDLGLRLDLTTDYVGLTGWGYRRRSAVSVEASVFTHAVIMFGILAWVLTAILLALLLARMCRLNKRWTAVAELTPAPRPRKQVPASMVEAMAGFPVEPSRFVGRAEVMGAAITALTPASGCRAVVFHGMAGVGKTTCAVELAYRHSSGFVALVFWSAPTDPDQFGDALRLLAVELEVQLGDHGLAMVEEIATPERLEKFLPTLTAVFADAGMLLVLDNLDTLLTPDGEWRDLRWALLVGALTCHTGRSRVILTSRVVPAGLDADMVLIRPLHALSREETLWLVGELPNLRPLLHSVALARRVLTLAQGHPALLELADAAAAEPPRLAYQLVEIEAAVGGGARAAFLTDGYTRLDAKQLRQTFTAWTITVAATTPAPSRLLLQALCRIEETDRNTTVISANWPALWRRLDQPGEPPPLVAGITPLITAALITSEPTDDPAGANEPVRYRIHPAVAEAIHSVTPEPVAAAVDSQLAAWWTAVVGGWGVVPQPVSQDAGMVRASLAAARYLLRQHEWNAASCLLERALIRELYSPVTSLALTPLLRRIAEATGALKDLVVLAAALRKVDAGEAETLLRRAFDRASADGEYQLASTTAGELVTLLRDQGRLSEALTLAHRKIEHTSKAGFGIWTQLSDQGRRLQILNLLGHHEQVLLDVPALRVQMVGLSDQRAHNDRVNPSNVREGILGIGRASAVALERWDDALELNAAFTQTQQRRGASAQEIARTRFNDYLPLRNLGRLTDADHLLRDCQDVFDTADDVAQLARVYGARADLEDISAHSRDAVDLQRNSLRLRYLCADPREISTAHHDLADYLFRAAENPAEQRAHRLTALLLHHLTGNTHELIRTLAVLAAELRGDINNSDKPELPTTLPEIVHLVEADDGIRFGDLVATLCPDPTTAEYALIGLFTTATMSAQPFPFGDEEGSVRSTA